MVKLSLNPLFFNNKNYYPIKLVSNRVLSCFTNITPHINHCVVNLHTNKASCLHMGHVTLFVGELGGFFLVHILTTTSAYDRADITPTHTSIKQLIPLLRCRISSISLITTLQIIVDISIIQLVTDNMRNSCYLLYVLLLSVSALFRTCCSRDFKMCWKVVRF